MLFSLDHEVIRAMASENTQQPIAIPMLVSQEQMTGDMLMMDEQGAFYRSPVSVCEVSFLSPRYRVSRRELLLVETV